ncbi:hypothetical protein AOZ07_11425 [Glutamicibacter halophytocola]|nr:hypothetical protein AOZ07_11425 [Glutamicibacter halophytocola]
MQPERPAQGPRRGDSGSSAPDVGGAPASPRITSRVDLVRKATNGFFGLYPNASDVYRVEPRLLSFINDMINVANQDRARNDKIGLLTSLPASAVAECVLHCFPVRIVVQSDQEDRWKDMLAVYESDGPNTGLHIGEPGRLRQLVHVFDPNIGRKGADDIVELIRAKAPMRQMTIDRDLVPVQNGIFNYKTKELLPFNESYVFTTKVRTRYVDAPSSPVIHDSFGAWDVESWVEELHDDPELVDLTWKVIGALVRPLVGWKRCIMPFDERGNNGKGTLLVLMRHLVGPQSWTSIQINRFSDKNERGKIVGKMAVLTDENDVGAFAKESADFKSCVTHDPVSIEMKYEKPFNYTFWGLMVQCLNGWPKAKDKSDSFYRRPLFFPFTKSFAGRENSAIKDDYLTRPEVAEYVLHKVLTMEDFYTLPEPAACKAVMEEYKQSNDPVRMFWGEYCNDYVWDLLPTSFLYEHFKAWFAYSSPSGTAMGLTEFSRQLAAIVRDDDGWKQGTHRVSKRMSAAEPLLSRWGLLGWTSYSPNKPVKGFLRTTAPRPAAHGVSGPDLSDLVDEVMGNAPTD